MEKKIERTLEITQDIFAEHPRRDFDHIGTIVSRKGGWHSELADENVSPDDGVMNLSDIAGGPAYALPVYCYDHSGLCLSTSSFHDRWDSGGIGMIFITEEDAKTNWPDTPKESAIRCMEAEIEEYNRYLSGDVWRFSISVTETITVDGKDYVYEDEEDSCGGFYPEKGKDIVDVMLEYGRYKREDFAKIISP